MEVGSQERLAITIGIALIVLVLVSINYVRRKTQLFTVFNLASAFYALVYGVIPIYYLFNLESAPLKIGAAYRTNTQFQIMLLALFGYVILIAGYFIGQRSGKKDKLTISEPVPYRKYERWALLAFLAGLFGVYIEVSLQGGIANTINSIESVRSFSDSAVKSGTSNPLVFFRMFKPFMMFSFYVYYFLSRNSGSVKHKAMTFITFILSAYVTFIGGGRTHIIIF